MPKSHHETLSPVGRPSRGAADRTMSRRDFLRASSMGAAGTLLAGATGVGGARVAEARKRRKPAGLALGAFAPSLPWSFRDIDAFAEKVGAEQAVVHWFQDWLMTFDPAYMDEAVSRGGVPLVTWEPWEFGEGLDQPAYALREILDGRHDAYVGEWARAAAAWGKPFFLRFAHEMNGAWTTWSPGTNGNTSREFVAAWRRVHGIFRREGAANARWVWSPVAHSEEHTPYGRVYPGDAYVDWFGISGYNWGNTRSWSRWQSFSEIFGASYRKMKRMAPGKPIMIAEVGCAEQGGDKASWIRRAYFEEMPKNFPGIKAVCWFDADKENDWRVDSSPGSLEAYRAVAADPRHRRRPV